MRWRLFLLLPFALVALSACTPLEVQIQQVSAASASPSTDTPSEAAPTTPRVPGAEGTELVLSTLVTYLTFLAELGGALVIAVGVIRGLLRYLPHATRRQPTNETFTEDIRLQLGKTLALALEFELGADILKTAVAPSLVIIAQLAAIAVLRTFLNYFLEQELRQAEQRRIGQHLAQSPQDKNPA